MICWILAEIWFAKLAGNWFEFYEWIIKRIFINLIRESEGSILEENMDCILRYKYKLSIFLEEL